MSLAMNRLIGAFGAAGYPTRQCGKGWRAACPACGTRSLKVAIGEGNDGHVLVHAFCGHSVDDVLAPLHMDTSELFEHRDLRDLPADARRRLRDDMRIAQWRAALPVLTEESSVILIAANQLSDGLALSEPDLQRLHLAALRLYDAREELTR